jgi:outer membrane immunogenic protein
VQARSEIGDGPVPCRNWLLFQSGALMIRRMTSAFLLNSAGLLALAPAHAEEFEGAYLGVQLGYSYGDFSIGNVGSTITDFDSDSVIGGFTAGYLFAVGGGWYVGPEFQYDWTNISITDAGSNRSTTLDRIGRLNVVAGYEIGNGMLYGNLGYAYTNLEGARSFFDGSSDGYAVGFGYDWWATEEWSVGAQYLYQKFDGIGSGGGDVGVSAIYLRTAFRF